MIWEPRIYQICRLVDRQDPHKENEFYVQKVEMVGDILTHDDVYVLDMGKKIFQFNGKNADIVHRHFATQFCFQVNYHDHRGESLRILLEVFFSFFYFFPVSLLPSYLPLLISLQDDEALDSDEKKYDWGVFWNCLGGEVELPHRSTHLPSFLLFFLSLLFPTFSLTLSISSEKVVPFGLAVNAVSVSVIGSWTVPEVGEIEEMEPEREGESELQMQEREEENELRAERVIFSFFFFLFSFSFLFFFFFHICYPF